jgi:hypothetical protein
VSIASIRPPRIAALTVARLLLALAALAAAAPAAAWSIGGLRTPVVIGQPLDLALAVSGGEPLARECVRVDARYGEQALPRGQLSVAVEPTADPARTLLRVRSVQAVDEPVVTLSVGLGCPARLTREFVLFAELPTLAAAPAGAGPQPAAVESPAPAVAAAPAATTAVEPPPPPPGSADAAAAAAAAPAAAASPPAARPRAARTAARAAAAAATPARTAARPRLHLELLPPAGGAEASAQAAQALQAVTARAEAAERAVLAAQAAAEQARQRVSELEAALTRQSADAQAQHQAILALQRDLAQWRAQSAWWPMLAGLLGAAALLATVAAWRARRPAAAPWWQPAATAAPVAAASASASAAAAAAAAAAAVVPQAPSTPASPAQPARAEPLPPDPPAAAVPVGAAAASPAWPGPQSPAAVDEAAGAAGRRPTPPPPTLTQDEPDVDLLAIADDEQIDLEQQVDFLCVLGQDEQAAALLRERLRCAAGRAPLPYLRLFEIYRRLGDRVAYERLAERFADHFHAVVPGWDETAADAAPLLEHPVLEDLQRCWADPAAARRTLAALLRHGQPTVAPWGLAAFEDLLLLYRIAGPTQDKPQPPVSFTLELSPLEPVGVAAATRPRKPRRKAEGIAQHREPRRDRELAPDFADAGPAD